jgi:flagellar biosynthetic protein FlhB
MKLVFGMSKLTVVGVVIYNVIISDLAEMTRLMEAEVGEILLFIIFKAALIGVLIALVLIVLGIADYTYQKWKFANDMKMTKQEVKEEYKQMEGDTHVKSKMKQMMQSFSRNRMKDNVPEADVIIANPVHYAIAVKYDPEGMAAPVCLAKGARKMALSIKEIAKENKIPIVENPLLARMLYKAVEVGELVPPQFYHAVAEVLAYVYRLNEKVDEKSQAAS